MSSLFAGISFATICEIIIALVVTAVFFYHLGFLRCYEADTKEEASRMDWECPECHTHAPIYTSEDLMNAWQIHDEQADCDTRWSVSL